MKNKKKKQFDNKQQLIEKYMDFFSFIYHFLIYLDLIHIICSISFIFVDKNNAFSIICEEKTGIFIVLTIE